MGYNTQKVWLNGTALAENDLKVKSTALRSVYLPLFISPNRQTR